MSFRRWRPLFRGGLVHRPDDLAGAWRCGGGLCLLQLPAARNRPATIGANQYGVFIQAFGLIRWRAIDKIELISIAERDTTIHELRSG